MLRSILFCSFLAYVSTSTEGTEGWFTETFIWTDSVIEASTLTYGWITDIWTDRRCKCSGVMVMVDKETGESVGECTVSKNGRPFCFVNYPDACQDSVPSSQFPGLDWSYEACEVQ
eukprot:GFUD01033773.1.p1 GENE.GFUD01033773.1~~GFUD01033773.1.p1  ORF type:complete len:128 (+),score=10.03 GFUD01033773.1:38-385(+)